MPRQRPRARAVVEPLEADDVKVAVAGTVLWAVAFVALVPFYGRLVDAGRGWLVWTCLAGFGLGVLGIEYCRRRAAGLAVPAGPADRRGRPVPTDRRG